MSRFDRAVKIYDTPIFQLYYLWAHKGCLNFIKNCIKGDFEILDVACGTGNFLKKLSKINSNIRIFGIDDCEGMVNAAKKKVPDGNFRVSDAGRLSFNDNSFDLVSIVDAFYYFQDKEKVISECYRVLKPGGFLFLFYPAVDLLPKLFLDMVKISSKLFLFNLEKDSAFPPIKGLISTAERNGFELVKKKINFMHRLILFKKALEGPTLQSFGSSSGCG